MVFVEISILGFIWDIFGEMGRVERGKGKCWCGGRCRVGCWVFRGGLVDCLGFWFGSLLGFSEWI